MLSCLKLLVISYHVTLWWFVIIIMADVPCWFAVILCNECPGIWSRSFKMSANFLPFSKTEAKKHVESYFLFLKGPEREKDWGRNRRREREWQWAVSKGKIENGDNVICVCLHVCLKISMSASRRGSTANSPGLFTKLSEGSDMLASRRLLSRTHVLLTRSSRCLTFSFSSTLPLTHTLFLFPLRSWPFQLALPLQVGLVLLKGKKGRRR